MKSDDPSLPPQTVPLARGGQVVINGALITAQEACTLDVASGAYVLTSMTRLRDRKSLRNPREELYFSIIEVADDPARFADEQFRLFILLSQVAAQEPGPVAQKECSLCATALLTGNASDAKRSASRLALLGLDSHRSPNSSEGGQRKPPDEHRDHGPAQKANWSANSLRN